MKFKNNQVIGLIAAMTLTAGVSAQNWNMATPYPEAEFHTQNINMFADAVRERTNGDLNITVHSGQSLFNHPEIHRAVRTGQIEAGEIMMANLANDDAMFAADNIPFLVDGYDSAMRLWEAQRPLVEQRMLDDGLVLLYAVPWPGQGFFTADEINSVDDMAGVRFRTYNSMTQQMANLMNAVPTTVEAVEIPQAFTAGIVDAMVTSAATGLRTEAWEFSNHYYDVRAWLPKNMIFVNQAAFNRLSEDTQTAVLELGLEAEARGWEMSEQVFADTTAALAERLDSQPASSELSQQLADIGARMSEDWSRDVGADAQVILEAIE